MITEFGHVYTSFRPKLHKHISPNHIEFFDYWQINNIAVPAPSINPNMKTAVWYGRRISRYGESPIVAATVRKGQILDNFDSVWYVGAANFGWEEGEFGKAASELELADLAIRNAEHGPMVFNFARLLIKSFMESQSEVPEIGG